MVGKNIKAGSDETLQLKVELLTTKEDEVKRLKRNNYLCDGKE